VSSASPFPAAPGMGDGEESAKDCAAERPTAKRTTSVEQARIERTYGNLWTLDIRQPCKQAWCPVPI